MCATPKVSPRKRPLEDPTNTDLPDLHLDTTHKSELVTEFVGDLMDQPCIAQVCNVSSKCKGQHLSLNLATAFPYSNPYTYANDGFKPKLGSIKVCTPGPEEKGPTVINMFTKQWRGPPTVKESYESRLLYFRKCLDKIAALDTKQRPPSIAVSKTIGGSNSRQSSFPYLQELRRFANRTGIRIILVTKLVDSPTKRVKTLPPAQVLEDWYCR